MDYLKRIIDQITQQLDVLGRSQKIAIGLCAVIVAGSLFWLVNYSTSPERVPVLDQNLTLDQIDTALAELQSQRIDAEQVGNRIYVKPADRDRALLALNRAEALPKDMSMGFAEYMADDDPFRPSDENRWRRKVALATELGRVLSSGDEVASARVLFQDKSQRRIGAVGQIEPTASVYLKLHAGGSFNRHLVEGVCRFVGGAVPGLAPHNVTVIDAATMRPFALNDPEELLGADLLTQRKQNEQHLTDKLLATLSSIPNVLVSVSVELDAARRKTQTQDYGKPTIKSEDSTETSTTSGSTSGESGVNANVGVALGGGQGGNKSSMEETHAEYYDSKTTKVQNIEEAPFSLKRATASIAILRSFIVGIHSARFGDAEEPAKLDEDPDFIALRDAEMARIRSAAMNILMTDDESAVDVTMFYDFAPESTELNTFPGGSGLVMASSDGGASGYLSRYGMQGGVAVLALISFLLMTRLVRKSSDVVAAVMPPSKSKEHDESSEEVLDVSGGPVGRAAASEGLLIGQEIDEETLRHTQLGDQISAMVEADPETASELIRRWVESDE